MRIYGEPNTKDSVHYRRRHDGVKEVYCNVLIRLPCRDTQSIAHLEVVERSVWIAVYAMDILFADRVIPLAS